MTDTGNKVELELEYVDIKTLHNCSSTIKNVIDKSIQKGGYSLDEIEKLIVSLNSLNRGVELLDKYQTFLLKKMNENKENLTKQEDSKKECISKT